MPIYIESPTSIYQGAEAAEKLAQKNDSRFVSDDGIVKVDDARWQVAQEYERATWLVHGINNTDDRADQHRDGFNSYVDLPQDLGRALELGCGVFTITNTILAGGRIAQHVTLVDPLAEAYKNHPHCTYREGYIQSVPVTIESVAIEQLELWPTQLFDTVIMVNVLSHCRDGQLVLDIARRAVAPGGVIVFQETVHDFDPFDVWDAGHPLRPTQAFLDAFMSQFEGVYRGSDNYFVGREAAETIVTQKPVILIEHEPAFKDEIRATEDEHIQSVHEIEKEFETQQRKQLDAMIKAEFPQSAKKPSRKSKGGK